MCAQLEFKVEEGKNGNRMSSTMKEQPKPSSIGFSVRDILDLPNTKTTTTSRSSRSSSLTALRPEPSALEGSIDTCVPAPGYHHPSAIYYCDSSYPRWLPPSADVFAYNPLCKYYCTSCCSMCV